jgi:hypothetical protein
LNSVNPNADSAGSAGNAGNVVAERDFSSRRSRGSRRYHSGDNGFEIRCLNLAPLDKVVRAVLNQHNPTKGRPQENNKPSQEA